MSTYFIAVIGQQLIKRDNFEIEQPFFTISQANLNCSSESFPIAFTMKYVNLARLEFSFNCLAFFCLMILVHDLQSG